MASVVALGALAGCSGGGDGNGGNGGDTTTTTASNGGDTTTSGGQTTTTAGNGGNTTTTSGGGGDNGSQAAVESYLSGANNFESIEDMTGQSEVTVDVGAGNGLAFGPAAVRVSSGTTVNWSWTGEGGSHNVVSAEDSDFEFRSGDPVSSGSFSQTFDQAGLALYYCNPHRGAGMKGAVVVE
ncbi:halocyanin domain-containing protein [Halomarina litorea]|uniref:halocyanin domain-containing protein n=1 Tax=Halomarina litorea TaxID=2961595 RepID=UPI0020C4D7C3|nr:halocyanin domain-containing protein [Halomarina sp. BCD28]